MAKEKSKADRIRELAGAGRSMKEIARRVGCTEAYARIYARQRRDGPSVADRNYKAKPETRELLRAKQRRYYQKNRNRILKEQRRSFAENRELMRERKRKWARARRTRKRAEAAGMGAAP